jgi:hypothetical protein
MIDRQRRVGRFEPESQYGSALRFVDMKRAQRPWIVENDARAVRKLDGGPRKSRKRVGNRVDVPITRHPKVNVNQTAIVERDELMLAASLDCADGCAAKSMKASRRIGFPQAPVQHSHVGDGLANGSSAENARGVFDFGELWHERRGSSGDGS